MLLTTLALAAELSPERAAAKLLKRARAGQPASAWFDADAWTAFAYRDSFPLLHEPSDPTGLAERLRALADAELRALAGADAAAAGIADAEGCMDASGGASAAWFVKPGAAVEFSPWWPARDKLESIAMMELTCPGYDAQLSLFLTLTTDVGWRIAGFPEDSELAGWRAVAKAATREGVDAKSSRRIALEAGLATRTVAWPSPSLPAVRRVRYDVDGDGLAEALGDKNELYRSTTGDIVPTDPAATVQIAGDIDGDGRADLLVIRQGEAQVWPAGDITKARSLVGVPAGPATWAAADLDGDGRSDLVSLANGKAHIWFGGGLEWTAELVLSAEPTAMFNLGDTNGDQTDELAFADPSYGDGAGALQVLTSPAAGTLGSFLKVIGSEHERLGTWLAGWDVDGNGTNELLSLRWEGITGKWVVDARAGDGQPSKIEVAPGLIVSGCAPPLIGDTDDDARTEFVSVCAKEIRIWTPGSTAVRSVPTSRTVPAASEFVATKDGLALAAWYPRELRLVYGQDWNVHRATVVPRPVAVTEAGDPAPDSAAGTTGVNPQDAKTFGPGVKTIHWSEAQFKRRVTPKSIRLPPGTDRADCLVRVLVSPEGKPTDVSFAACPEMLRASVRDAVMASAWYPLRGVSEPYSFELRYIFRQDTD